MSQLSMFDGPGPSAHKSKTSVAAAEALDGPFQANSHRKLMLALASQAEPVSRAWLSSTTGLPIAMCCARLSELVPDFVECVEGACQSHVKPTLRVNGYRLTPSGRARLDMPVRR